MKKFIVSLLLIICSIYSQAQIKTSSTDIEDWVKKHFAGDGIIIGNIKIRLAGADAIALFSSKDVLQIENGLVISTGKTSRIAVKNDKYNESTSFNKTNKPEIDYDLSKILYANFYDISSIEFDLVSFNNSIQFNYQFGSEEYPEYVGSPFNDIFAFIISDSKTSKNIALVPQKNTPVSVNTINHLSDSSYYINNNVFTSQIIAKNKQPVIVNKQPKSNLNWFKTIFRKNKKSYDYNLIGIKPDEQLIKNANQKLYQNLQFDGITTKLVAQTFVEPYKKYYLKIVIADVSDNVYDSGVFLEQGSLTTKKDTSQSGFKEYTQITDSILLLNILNGNPLPKNLNNNEDINNSYIIYFDSNQFSIKPSELIKINKIKEEVEKLSGKFYVEITGHTDALASLDYNLKLSNKRSNSVKNALNSVLKSPKNYKIVNKAYLVPVKTNLTETGRAENRRVEIRLIKE